MGITGDVLGNLNQGGKLEAVIIDTKSGITFLPPRVYFENEGLKDIPENLEENSGLDFARANGIRVFRFKGQNNILAHFKENEDMDAIGLVVGESSLGAIIVRNKD